ncbi:hypothetical protein D9M68_946950 [compost metagenome]
MQGAETFQGRCQRQLEVGLAGHVELQRQAALGAGVEPVGGSLGAFQRKVGDHHGVTCCEQAVGDGEAEALGGAGDQCNLVHGGALTGCSQYPRGYRWS